MVSGQWSVVSVESSGIARFGDSRALASGSKLRSGYRNTASGVARFGGGNNGWDYKIVAPGFKYNMTDIAAAIGIHQLRRAEALRERLISLPIFPGMTPAELAHVVGVVRQLCRRHAVVERRKPTHRLQAE